MAPITFDESEDTAPLRPVGDLAGIPALDVDGGDAGEVFGALTDADTGLIRYFDIFVARSDRHVLVPVGHARIDAGQTGPRLQLRAVTRKELLEIPAYDRDFEALDDAFHQSVLAAFGRFLYGERYYAHPAFDHSGLYAGDHPIVAGDGAEAAEGPPLRPLAELSGYKVADGEPDVRGYPLLARGRERAGTVEELLVDTDSMQVRYLAVALADRLEGAERVLLPVGFVQIQDGEVRAPALRATELGRLPGYRPGPITREEENRLREVLETILSGPRRYERPEFQPLPLM